MLSARSVGHVAPARAGRASAPFGPSRPVHHDRRSLNVTRVANINTDAFEAEVLKADKPVLVDFWAPWCGPCKLVAPLMDWVEQEYAGRVKVVKIEHDANPELIAKYKVYGLPTLIVFKEGQEIPGSKREGAVTKALLAKYLASNGI